MGDIFALAKPEARSLSQIKSCRKSLKFELIKIVAKGWVAVKMTDALALVDADIESQNVLRSIGKSQVLSVHFRPLNE